jgi:hypothetical protein
MGRGCLGEQVSDGLDHLRAVVRRYKTDVAEGDATAPTVQSDGGPIVRPEGRVRGSPEHLHDLTYTIEALIDEAARERRARAALTTQSELALREQRSETLALAAEVWWSRRAVLILAVGLGGCYALGSLGLAMTASHIWVSTHGG